MTQPRLLTLILTTSGLTACIPEAEVCDICKDVVGSTDVCPPAADVELESTYVEYECRDDELEATSITGPGFLSYRWDPGEHGDLVCCYEGEMKAVEPNDAIGRPFVQGTTSLESAIGRADGWCESDSPTALGKTILSSAQRIAWSRAGAAEHASIAAFARLSLELMAHGAPADLIRAAHHAALDEVNHAQRCFELASLTDHWVGPGPFPFVGTLNLTHSLAEIAADAVIEGCVGETMGAILVRAAAEGASDPMIRSVLTGIAEDEERHAAYSWQVVVWALRAGGEPVRVAVIAAFRTAPMRPNITDLSLRSGVPEATLQRALLSGVRDVIAPATRALLAA